MFPFKRRSPFNTDTPVTGGENLTGYDERYVLPTDGGNTPLGGDLSQSAPAQSMPMQGATSQSAFGTTTAVAQQRLTPQYDVSPTATTERPMVFALRAYPDMFVYEYSDRFEYYRRTPNGMERCNTEYRNRQ